MQPTHVVLSEDGNDYKMILRVELWRNSPSWTLCMLPTGTEDEAVKTLLSSMDKTASGQARYKKFPQPNRGGWTKLGKLCQVQYDDFVDWLDQGANRAATPRGREEFP